MTSLWGLFGKIYLSDAFTGARGGNRITDSNHSIEATKMAMV